MQRKELTALDGGGPLRRCHIYKLLGNVLYTGQVKVGDEIFPGEQDAIISPWPPTIRFTSSVPLPTDSSFVPKGSPERNV